MPDLATPPHADEVEVSLFGPGFGECILVHLGSGNWLLVDSCFDQRRRVQPALEYLRRIGHDPASAVRLVVATHWHDDHIRGLAEVVRTCEAADFYCSSALRKPEVLTVIGTQAAYTQSSGARELHDVLTVLGQRSAVSGSPLIRWAGAERLLFRKHLIDERTESTVTVTVAVGRFSHTGNSSHRSSSSTTGRRTAALTGTIAQRHRSRPLGKNWLHSHPAGCGFGENG